MPVPAATRRCSASTSPTRGQHLEHRSFVDHDAPELQEPRDLQGRAAGRLARTPSGSATSSSAPQAEGTDTYELNRNLVLTDGARADSVPNLEIETGEIVGAGHASRRPAGSTTSSCSTCRRAASPRTRPAASSCAASSPTSSARSASPSCATGSTPTSTPSSPRPQRAGAEVLGAARVSAAARWAASGHRRRLTWVCNVDDLRPAPPPRSESTASSSRWSATATATSTRINDTCTHADVSLSEGEVDGCTLECWLHGSRFDAAHRRAVRPPGDHARRRLPREDRRRRRARRPVTSDPN